MSSSLRLEGAPRADGFFMPAEFSPHEATVMIFPERPGSWPYKAEAAAPVFAQMIKQIALGEKIYVGVNERTRKKAEELIGRQKNVTFLDIPSNDAWARDIGPTFVTNGKEVRAVNWRFNAWGGEFDGLYKDWALDDAFAVNFCEKTGYIYYDAGEFVLEGGSIHSDGEGTLLVTESCLLSGGRNPDLSKEQITERLKNYLGAEKVLWLPRGIFGDETNEHVDNVCAFIRPAEVVLAWTDDKNDPQYELSRADLEYLENETDAKGRKITVHKLPVPDFPVTVTEHDMAGFEFEEGEDVREVGERLAASYVNFYFFNRALLFPVFGGKNKESDRRAEEIFVRLCGSEREIIAVPAEQLIVGGGNIHCLTQQIPLPTKKEGIN